MRKTQFLSPGFLQGRKFYWFVVFVYLQENIWHQMIMITLEAGYGGLQFQMIEIFIPIIEEITRAKELVIHHLGLDLNHLNIGLPRFKILKFSRFFMYFFIIFSLLMNLVSSFKNLSFQLLFNVRLKGVSLLPTYCIRQIL